MLRVRQGTKTRAEREDEEAERLIRRSPKVKPPRRDLRREVIQETDLDKERDFVQKGDKDREDVEKKAFALVAKGLVPVRRKEDDRVVNVSEETLKSNPSAYEEVKEDEKDLDKEISGLLSSAKSDPKVEYKLRALFDPTSLGGIVEANPQMDAGAMVGLPKGLISLKDLKDRLSPHMNSKGFIKSPKKKTEAPSKTESQNTEAPPEVTTGNPSTSGAPSGLDGTSGAPSGPDGPPPPKEEVQTPPAKEAPRGQPQKSVPPSKEPPRRKFTEEEQFKARDRLYASLPPTLARKFFDAHPDDIQTILREYRSFKALKSDVPIQKLAETFQLDPSKVPIPKEVWVGNKKVPLESLSKEAQTKRIRNHQLTVVAASMAARSSAIKEMRASGVGPMSAQLVDSSLRVLSIPKGPDRELAQKKEANRLFLKNSGPKSSPASERFGSESDTSPRTSLSARKSALSKASGPQRGLLKALYAGEDFAHAVSRYLPKPGDNSKDAWDKLKKAESFLSGSSQRSSDIDVLGIFLKRVKSELSSAPPGLLRQVEKMARANHEERLQLHETKLAAWRRKNPGQEPPAGLFTRPSYVSEGSSNSKFRGIFASYSPYSPTKSGVTTGMDKKAIQAAEQALTGLDRMASTIEKNHAEWGMDPRLAAALLRSIDKIADGLESSVMGEASMLARQASLLEGEKDEDYMSAFDAPSEVHESDSDEDYMSLFDDDQTEAVHDVA